jgi:hypothetical protein
MIKCQECDAEAEFHVHRVADTVIDKYFCQLHYEKYVAERQIARKATYDKAWRIKNGLYDT